MLAGKRKALCEGCQMYDFFHVSGAARAFAEIGMRGIENRHYVIASGDTKPLWAFLTELRDMKTVQLTPVNSDAVTFRDNL